MEMPMAFSSEEGASEQAEARAAAPRKLDALGALEMLAGDLLKSEFPEAHKAMIVRVVYFGRGNRYDVKRNASGILVATLYIHKDVPASEFVQIVRDAGAAAARMTERKVSVNVRTLAKLLVAQGFLDASAEPLTESEIAALRELVK